MPDCRLQPQSADGTGTPDAENHLLSDTSGLVAAVKTIGNVPVGGCVVLTIGVEQIDGDATDQSLPEPGYDIAPGDTDSHLQPASVRLAHRLDGQIAWIVFAILGVLNAVVIDSLGEVALPIEQADGEEIEPLIAGSLAMIARENAQAPRIDWKALVKAVLRTEVRDQWCVPCGRRCNVFVESRKRLLVTA